MSSELVVTGLKWWHYRQNNSGGHFTYNPREGVSVNVYIQAKDCIEADFRAGLIGIYFNGVQHGKDCECCGDRWFAQADWGTPVEDSEIPAPDILWEKNASRFIKWIDNGYETFVHSHDGKFYGSEFAGTTAEVI